MAKYGSVELKRWHEAAEVAFRIKSEHSDGSWTDEDIVQAFLDAGLTDVRKATRDELVAAGYDAEAVAHYLMLGPVPSTQRAQLVGEGALARVERGTLDANAYIIPLLAEAEGQIVRCKYGLVARDYPDDPKLHLRFAYNPQLVERVKAVPGRVWNPATKEWTVPADQLDAAVAALGGKA